MRLLPRYTLLGALAGIIAPMGLFGYAVVAERAFDPLDLFLVLALGGVVTFAGVGSMIGRRDEALVERNCELSRLSDLFRTLSATDELTGLPNRRTFDERATAEISRSGRYGTPLVLVMVDLDHFKKLNDEHGHLAGDEVLRQTAALLAGESRLGDVVARWGGEEFIALLPHTDATAAVAWAERARTRVASAALPWKNSRLRVTASFGVAAAPTHGGTLAELVAAADAALYDAKRRGRNQVVAGGSSSLLKAMTAAQK